MPKGVLEFNLPEEEIEFSRASRALDWSIVVRDIDQYLRSKTKYASDGVSDDAYKAYEDVRTHLWGLLNAANLDTDNI